MRHRNKHAKKLSLDVSLKSAATGSRVVQVVLFRFDIWKSRGVFVPTFLRPSFSDWITGGFVNTKRFWMVWVSNCEIGLTEKLARPVGICIYIMNKIRNVSIWFVPLEDQPEIKLSVN